MRFRAFALLAIVVVLLSAGAVVVCARAWQPAPRTVDHFVEHFELSGLSDHEKELFEDLKNNRINETELQKLIDTGVLNNALMDKFLAILSELDGGDDPGQDQDQDQEQEQEL
jgi:hypothetical protein